VGLQIKSVMRKYSDELKEQIIRECQEVGNASVVAR
jgi:transposase-like protein